MNFTVRGLRVLVPAAAAILLSSTPAGAVAAAPGFGAPVDLAAPSSAVVGEPAVAVTASGRVVAAWDQQFSSHSFGIVVRRGAVSGRFGAPERVSLSGGSPSVAAGGGAAVVWQAFARGGTRRVQVAVARGQGRFGRPQTLVSVRANVVAQQVLAVGDHYLAIWWQGVPGAGRHAVRYAISDRSGRFGAVRTLAPNTGPLSAVSAAAAPDGTVTAAWGTPLGGTPATNQQLAYATLAPGAKAFGPAQGVRAVAADQGAETEGIQVTAGPGGTALTWTEAGAFPELLRAAQLVPGSMPTPQTVLSLDSTDLGKRYATGPALALPGHGSAPVAGYAIFEGPGGESEQVTGGRVYAVAQRSDGTHGDPVQLSAPGTIATQPAAGATSTSTVVAWTTGAFPRYGLRYAVRSPSGTFGPARPLTTGFAERQATLASSPHAVVAVWVSRAGTPGPHPSGGKHGIALAILHG